MSTIFDPPVGPADQELGSAPEAPPEDDLELGQDFDDGEPPMVDEGMVRSILEGVGNMASMVDRAAPGLWKFTVSELDQLTPPITRLANRNATLRRALLQGDYVVLALGLSQYTVRNLSTRKEAVDAKRLHNQISGGPRANGSAADPRNPAGGAPAADPRSWGASDLAPGDQ